MGKNEFLHSSSFSVTLSYLERDVVISLQLLSRRFYKVLIPKFIYRVEFTNKIYHYKPAQKVLQIYNVGSNWTSYKMVSKCKSTIGQQVIWVKPSNRVFVIGGYTHDHVPPYVWEFKEKRAKMIKRIRMEQGRKFFGCESFDDIVYIVGGQLQLTNTATVTWLRYSINNNKFEEIAILNKKRYGATLWEFNGKYLYAFGGHRQNNNNYSKTSFERIKFSEMRISTYWEDIEFDVGILEPENYVSWVPINSCEIMIFGGQKNNFKFDEVYIYDVDLNILIKDDDWPLKQADFFEMKNFIYIENKRKFIIAGAYYIHQFDKSTRRWSVLGKSIFHKYMGLHNLETAKARLHQQTL
jgi:hypothetical protein